MSLGDRTIEILLVEDNPGDVILTQEAFAEGNFNSRITVIGDGEEALDYFSRLNDVLTAGSGELSRPDLVLLDLNLPKVDGPQVLDAIKSGARIKDIPVVVLTSSEADRDVIRSYDLNANGYVVKPLTIEQFMTVVRTLEGFWFNGLD